MLEKRRNEWLYHVLQVLFSMIHFNGASELPDVLGIGEMRLLCPLHFVVAERFVLFLGLHNFRFYTTTGKMAKTSVHKWIDLCSVVQIIRKPGCEVRKSSCNSVFHNLWKSPLYWKNYININGLAMGSYIMLAEHVSLHTSWE